MHDGDESWPLRTERAGEAKVAEFDDAGFGHQHVLRLDVAVDDLRRMTAEPVPRVHTLCEWQNCSPSVICHRYRRTVAVGRPRVCFSISWSSVWSTYSNTCGHQRRHARRIQAR